MQIKNTKKIGLNLFCLSIISGLGSGLYFNQALAASTDVQDINNLYNKLGCVNKSPESCKILGSGLQGPGNTGDEIEHVNLNMDEMTGSGTLSANKYGFIGQTPNSNTNASYTQIQNYEFDIYKATNDGKSSNELYFNNVDSLTSTKFVFKDANSSANLGLHFVTSDPNKPIKLNSVDYTLKNPENNTSTITIYADSVNVDRFITNANTTKFELGFVLKVPSDPKSDLSFNNLSIGKNLVIETSYIDYTLKSPITFADGKAPENITFNFTANSSTKNTTFNFQGNPVDSKYTGILNFIESSKNSYGIYTPDSYYDVNLDFNEATNAKEVNIHQEGLMKMNFNTKAWESYTGELNFTSNQVYNAGGINADNIWSYGYVNFKNDSGSLTQKLGASGANISLAGKFAFNDTALKNTGFTKLNEKGKITDETSYKYTSDAAKIKLIDANGANVVYNKGTYILFDKNNGKNEFVDINTGKQYFIGKGTDQENNLNYKYTVLNKFVTSENPSASGSEFGKGDLSMITKIVGVDISSGGFTLKADPSDSTTNTKDKPIAFGADESALCKAYGYACGIYGTGDLTIDGKIYLAGDNTYTGKTILKENSSLFINDQLAITKADLVFNDNSSFGVIDGKKAEFENKSFNISSNNVTIGDTAATSSGNLILNKNSNLKFEQKDNTTDLSMSITNTNMQVTGGSSVEVNYHSDYLKDDNSKAGNEYANLTLNIDKGGKLSIGGDSIQSTSYGNLKLGNGFVNVNENGTLDLNQGGMIYIGGHNDGNLEHKDNAYSNGSINLNGGTINMTLSDYNKVVTTHLVQKDHKHQLLSGKSGSADDFYKSGTINVKVDKNSAIANLDEIKALDTALGGKLTSDGVKLDEIVDALAKAGSSAYEKLSDILDLTLNDANSLQSFKFNIDKNGIYMAADKVKQASEFFFNLSLHQSADEVIDKLVNQGYDSAEVKDLKQSSGAFNIIESVINYVQASPSEQRRLAGARVIDATGQIATIGGVQTIAFDALATQNSALDKHIDKLNYTKELNHLWADVLYTNNHASDLYSDVNGSRDFNINMYGAIIGVDRSFTDNLLAGASISYLQGDSSNSIGYVDMSNVKNEANVYAASIYGKYKFTDKLSLLSNLTYQYGTNDLTLQFPELIANNLGQKELNASVATHSVNLRGILQHQFNVNDFNITPYVGLNYRLIKTNDYTSKLGAMDAWHRDDSIQHIISTPLGLKVSTNLISDSGMSFYPHFEVYVQPNFGDVKVKNKVQGEGLIAQDTESPEITGKIGYGANVGLGLQITDNTILSFDYDYKGSNKNSNHSLQGSIQVLF